MKNSFHRHINSEVLKKQYKDTYKALFENCPIVVSAPMVYPLSPIYAVGPGGIGITKKLPFRMYLGIEPTTSGGIKFGPTLYFHPEKNKFVQWEPGRCSPIFLKLLENFCLESGKKVNARLWSIVEMPWYRGLNIDSLYATVCASALFLFLGLINSKDLRELVSQSSSILVKSEIFQKLFRFAVKLESIIANWVADGHMVFGSLIKSQNPTIFFRERDPILFDFYKDLGIKNSASFYNIFEKLSYCGLRFDEALNIDPLPLWPLDMAIIFSGEEIDSQMIYPTRKALTAKLGEDAAFAQKSLEKFVPKDFKEPPKFLSVIKENEKYSAGMNLFRTYRNDSVVHSISVLKTVYNLLLYGSTSGVIREFLEAQNINQDILKLLGLSSAPIDHISTTIKEIGLRATGNIIATRLIGTGGGGCLMVFGPLNSLENILNEALPIAENSIKKPIHCHWASWCDGNAESEGVIIEQNIGEKIFAEFVSGENLPAVLWHNGEKTNIIFSPEKWKKEVARLDLALDAENKKIFIKGKAMSSSQIHSTKQTIEIFEILFARETNAVRGENLPPSSYRTDRNQMESKVIRPLTTAFKKITGQNLGLEIHGRMGSDYSISFKPPKLLKIGLVKRKG